MYINTVNRADHRSAAIKSKLVSQTMKSSNATPKSEILRRAQCASYISEYMQSLSKVAVVGGYHNLATLFGAISIALMDGNTVTSNEATHFTPE